MRPGVVNLAARATRPGAPWGLWILGALFALGALLAVATFVSQPETISPPCAFGDGTAYCAAAEGEQVAPPFNQRPVAPALAAALPWSVVTSFRFLSIASLVVIAGAGAVLSLRIATRCAVAQRERRAIAPLIVSAVVVIPHGLRMAWSVPTMVDQASLAAGLIWAVLFTDRRAAIRWCSVAAALLATGTREIWGPLIVLAALTSLLGGRNRALVGANVAAAALAFGAVTFLLPVKQGTTGYSAVDIVQFGWQQNLGDPVALRQTTWSIAFAAGLLPVALLLRPPIRWLRSELRTGEVTGAVVLVLGLSLLGSAVLTGSDVTRYLYPAGIVLMVVAVPWIAGHPDLHLAAVPLGLATLILWAPGRALIATEAEYLDYYYGRMPTLDLSAPLDPKVGWGVAVAAAATLLALGLAVAARRRSDTVPPAWVLSPGVDGR